MLMVISLEKLSMLMVISLEQLSMLMIIFFREAVNVDGYILDY
jgi:hypothetical protein